MRPITLSCIHVALGLLLTPLSLDEFAEKLQCSRARARELLQQLSDMNLIRKVKSNKYVCSELGIKMLESLDRSNYQEIHLILMQYAPYRRLFEILSHNAYSYDELSQYLGINKLNISVLLRLMKNANIRIARTSDDKIYIERREISYDQFTRELIQSYIFLSKKFNIPKIYVNISELRRNVIEKLRIAPDVFDNFLIRFIRENPGRVVLSPAPPTLASGSGLKFGRIEYHYIRIITK